MNAATRVVERMRPTTAPATQAAAATSGRGRPRWEWTALAVVLIGTAVLYLWGLGSTGYGNSFYAAAVQAGTQSWKALLFGSLDAGNVITVDKPPASLWLMGLSGRIFGFSTWSMLAPQALLGVGSVALLYAAVRRCSGPIAGLVAGGPLALTPVAVLMFRFNNPDALLVFLLVLAAYFMVRAVEKGQWRWILLAGSAIGFGFLTKMLQAFLVLPAFALMYLVAAPVSLPKRLLQLLGAGASVIISAGWFVALVDLWPSASRPYIGGSENNTELELALGYNGLGRILGQGAGPGGGGPGGGGMGSAFGGETGILRMFNTSFGTEVSWLLPAALVGLVAGLWFTRRAPRTDRTRASLILWGGWTVGTMLVFSFMSGTIHPYYVVALAPGIAGLIGISVRELWRGREHLPARITLSAMVAVTGAWSFVLLERTPDWLPALRWLVLVLGVLAATAIAVGAHRFRRAAVVVAVVTALAGLSATAAYAQKTASVPHTGSLPMSGPSGDGTDMMGRQGGQGGPGTGTANAELVAALQDTDTDWAAAAVGAQGQGGLQLASGRPVIAIGGFNGGDPAPTLEQFKQWVAEGRIAYFVSGGGMGMGGGPGGGIPTGVGQNTAPDEGTGGTNDGQADGQAGDRGFGGDGPGGGGLGGGFGGGPGGGSGNEISSWVEDHFEETTIGGVTVYELR
ncbi:ArnT family glycosyltransferase [Prauserella alba]|uniref:Glycosyltransferase family 39 protein n=1 Tax=Prauserella alba TaxID=176898 RepID=A0ABP4GCL0_9PSEU|nr:glycosyltransferase family 39 protein [Prauserella alba]MCP2183780.1 4-amino-4-deoxy-L-arabinose transferase [Prauserella alba]